VVRAHDWMVEGRQGRERDGSLFLGGSFCGDGAMVQLVMVWFGWWSVVVQ
jgi:hypothetical protein